MRAQSWCSRTEHQESTMIPLQSKSMWQPILQNLTFSIVTLLDFRCQLLILTDGAEKSILIWTWEISNE